MDSGQAAREARIDFEGNTEVIEELSYNPNSQYRQYSEMWNIANCNNGACAKARLAPIIYLVACERKKCFLSNHVIKYVRVSLYLKLKTYVLPNLRCRK